MAPRFSLSTMTGICVLVSESGFSATMRPTVQMMRVQGSRWRLAKCPMSLFLTSDYPTTTAIFSCKVSMRFLGLLEYP